MMPMETPQPTTWAYLIDWENRFSKIGKITYFRKKNCPLHGSAPKRLQIITRNLWSFGPRRRRDQHKAATIFKTFDLFQRCRASWKACCFDSFFPPCDPANWRLAQWWPSWENLGSWESWLDLGTCWNCGSRAFRTPYSCRAGTGGYGGRHLIKDQRKRNLPFVTLKLGTHFFPKSPKHRKLHFTTFKISQALPILPHLAPCSIRRTAKMAKMSVPLPKNQQKSCRQFAMFGDN